MFSGQGSQYYQMGRKLFEKNPLFKQTLQAGNEICMQLTGLSVIDELYHIKNKKENPFDRTLLTHPAIFMVEYGLALVLLDQGIRPDYVLGTSLGEFAAAALAGIFTFETGLKAVITQAQMLENNCKKGRMLAILDHPNLYNAPILKENSELAGVHFHSHFVISGSEHKMLSIETYLKSHNILYQPLTVQFGFHSACIDNIAEDYLDFMKSQVLKDPLLPYISCVHATQLNSTKTQHFWDCVRRPVQFQSTIEMLERQDHYLYIDVGPSGSLATFVKYQLDKHSFSETRSFLTPFG
jgi:trans-AT polyketide synthase/acyltransferase/oxidoreductase domain-containing protein